MNTSSHGMARKFAVMDALLIQAQQLDVWKAKLTPQAYAALEKEVAHQNGKMRTNISTSDDVWRGCSMDSFVHNWRPTP